MKKFCVTVTAIIASALFIFVGCAPSGTQVLNYLKAGKEFGGKSTEPYNYRVDLTVNEDLSYALSVSYDGTDALRDYSAEGSTLEYLGCYEKDFTTEWLGVTQNNTAYYHVVRLPEATVEIDGDVYTFHIIAHTISKNSDSYLLSVVYYMNRDSDTESEPNLYGIANRYPSLTIRKK